jgi:single-stranded DNA-specific DHH superfamily exonuclease
MNEQKIKKELINQVALDLTIKGEVLSQSNQQIVTELNQFYDDTIEDYILWDKKENGQYPIDRIHQALKSFINKLSN